MKRRLATQSFMLIIMLFLSVPFVSAKEVQPIVDTTWLEKNITNPRVVVVDVRKVEEYREGHIPNAVNIFYGSWAVSKGELRNELPMMDDLFDVIGSAGIGPESIVVVVGKADKIADRADMGRVAYTLKYAGVKNIALLDGGYNKWVAEKKPISADVVKAKSTKYKGKVDAKLFSGKKHVMSRSGKATIVDVREADFYTGEKKMDFVAKVGHIKGAVSLPSSLAYNADGTFKQKADLQATAAKAVGKKLDKEIIIYCDTGKVCSLWAIVLTDLLGYKNIKVYDGSMEEWTKDPKAPVISGVK